MKKLFLVLVALLSFNVFAEVVRTSLTTGNDVSMWTIGTKTFNNGKITEICPVNNNVCKVVIDGKFVEYVKLNEILELMQGIDLKTSYYEITGFDYNKITVEKTKKPE